MRERYRGDGCDDPLMLILIIGTVLMVTHIIIFPAEVLVWLWRWSRRRWGPPCPLIPTRLPAQSRLDPLPIGQRRGLPASVRTPVVNAGQSRKVPVA